MMSRPVGHVTELIRIFDRWIIARERKELPTTSLKRAKVYLEEYRDLLNQEKSKQYEKI